MRLKRISGRGNPFQMCRRKYGRHLGLKKKLGSISQKPSRIGFRIGEIIKINPIESSN
jgi:hypothetical protein